jgi:hypothetical protein
MFGRVIFAIWQCINVSFSAAGSNILPAYKDEVSWGSELYQDGYVKAAFGNWRNIVEDPTKNTSAQLEALDAIEGCLKASTHIHNESALIIAEAVANDRQSNIDVRLAAVRLIYLLLKPDYKKHEFIKRIATIMQVDGGLSIKKVSIVFAEGFWADLEREKNLKQSSVEGFSSKFKRISKESMLN